MLTKKILIVVLCVSAIVSAPSVVAHGGATGVIKERMDLMDDMKWAMKELAAMFKGHAKYDVDTVRTYASAIRDNSGEAITNLFPETGAKGHTEARPEIWQQWQRFETLALRQQVISQNLINAANNRKPASQKTGMMDSSSMMGSSMMGQNEVDTNIDYASMSADELFKALADNCSSCHTRFRVKN